MNPFFVFFFFWIFRYLLNVVISIYRKPKIQGVSQHCTECDSWNMQMKLCQQSCIFFYCSITWRHDSSSGKINLLIYGSSPTLEQPYQMYLTIVHFRCDFLCFHILFLSYFYGSCSINWLVWWLICEIWKTFEDALDAYPWSDFRRGDIAFCGTLCWISGCMLLPTLKPSFIAIRFWILWKIVRFLVAFFSWFCADVILQHSMVSVGKFSGSSNLSYTMSMTMNGTWIFSLQILYQVLFTFIICRCLMPLLCWEPSFSSLVLV